MLYSPEDLHNQILVSVATATKHLVAKLHTVVLLTKLKALIFWSGTVPIQPHGDLAIHVCCVCQGCYVPAAYCFTWANARKVQDALFLEFSWMGDLAGDYTQSYKQNIRCQRLTWFTNHNGTGRKKRWPWVFRTGEVGRIMRGMSPRWALWASNKETDIQNWGVCQSMTNWK